MRKEPTRSVLKRLFALSGNQCAFPDCENYVINNSGNLIADVCHIEAANEDGERYNPSQDDEQRRKFNNLIILCTNHHRETNDVIKFTTEVMKKMKSDHEIAQKKKSYMPPKTAIDDAIKQLSVQQSNTNIGSGVQTNTVTGNITINHQGLTIKDATDLITSLHQANFPILKKFAEEAAAANVEKFAKEFFSQGSKKLTPEDLSRLAEPDVQFMMNEAMKMSARTDSEQLRKDLAGLIISRLKHDKEDIKRVVLNESITTIGKLTPDELKIITICFLLHYTCNNGLLNWQVFQIYLKYNILPFLDFSPSQTQFDHIQYAGCGSSISVLTWDYLNILRLQYSSLFVDGFTQEEITSFEIPEEILQNIVYLNYADNKFYLNILNSDKLDEYLREAKIEEEKVKKFTDKYNNKLPDIKTIREKLMTDPVGAQLLKVWDTSALKNLELTPVGKAIAATHYEEVTRVQLNLDIWIN